MPCVMILPSLGTLYVIKTAPPLLNKVLLFESMFADFAFRVITRGCSVLSSLAPAFPPALHWVGELLWVSLYVLVLNMDLTYDNVNLLALTFFFLVLSAAEFGIGAVLILAQNILRETLGVSRSKYADLITALVPASWAVSTANSEGVDNAAMG